MGCTQRPKVEKLNGISEAEPQETASSIRFTVSPEQAVLGQL